MRGGRNLIIIFLLLIPCPFANDLGHHQAKLDRERDADRVQDDTD